MKITPTEGKKWRQWIQVTSIPLVRLGESNRIVGFGSGTLIDYDRCRFIIAAEHVVKSESSGWAVVVQQDEDGKLEFYRPNSFTYVGELTRHDATVRLLDLCAAQIPTDLETWYEYRTPRGLFEKRPHHIFGLQSITDPESEQIFGFSGQVRTERHSVNTFASDMAVYPGLTYLYSEDEVHHFKLPVQHPGHDAFQGCSGSPIVDLNQRVVAIVVGGDIVNNTIKGVSIQRILPNLRFLASRSAA